MGRDNYFTETEYAEERSEVKSGTLRAFVNAANHYPLLSREEETALGQEILKGGEAAKAAVDELTLHNLRLVLFVARKNFAKVANDDLLSNGYIGLYKAARSYDCTYGVPFANHAAQYIYMEMLRGLRNDNLIHLPEQVWQEAGKDSDGRPPFPYSFVSLEGEAHEDYEESLESTIPDENAADPALETVRALLSADLKNALECLTDREKAVILRHYVLGEESFREIAESPEFSCSKEKVRRIHNSALAKLKEALENWEAECE